MDENIIDHEFVALIREIYQKIGGKPDDLTIDPLKGFSGINYKVKKKDGKEVTIFGRDLDDRNFLLIQTQLDLLLNESSQKSED